MWQVFEPFSGDLWAMLVASTIYGALIMFLLHCIDSGYHTLDSIKLFPSFVYHTLAAILGGDEYGLYHCVGLGRLYRIGLLFLVLVFSATYTANLAAYLTQQNFVIHGPRTMEQLTTSNVCWLWPGANEGSYDPFVGKLVMPPPDVLDLQLRQVWAHTALQTGECDAILEILPSAKAFSLKHCDTVHLDRGLDFFPVTDYNIMRGDDIELWRNVSEAILLTMATPAYNEMVTRNLRFAESCPSTRNDTSKVTAAQMSGVVRTWHMVYGT
jgi:hypothetical protein